MSKHLLIMRHAKSSWSKEGLTDFERPLNKRGLRVAPQMARFVELQDLVPDLIVSSSAVRAKMTTELFVEHCKNVTSEQVILNKDFYHAPAETYLEYLTEITDATVSKVMFVGHNPGMEELIEVLSGDWERMPTAAVAHFVLGFEKWSEIGEPIRAKLNNVWRPKEVGID